MSLHSLYRVCTNSPWTWSLSAVLLLLNLGLYPWAPLDAASVLTALEFDGTAIRTGEWWRLLTANFVHLNPNHFYLDVGVFVVLGFMYEKTFRGLYPWLLLVMALAGSVAGLVFWPEQTTCRGLSAVDSGLFAAALCVECRLAWHERSRWLWVGPATAIFAVKNIYEGLTGHSFFSTDSLLGPAQFAVAAHLGGIASALAFMAAAHVTSCWAAPIADDTPAPHPAPLHQLDRPLPESPQATSIDALFASERFSALPPPGERQN